MLFAFIFLLYDCFVGLSPRLEAVCSMPGGYAAFHFNSSSRESRLLFFFTPCDSSQHYCTNARLRELCVPLGFGSRGPRSTLFFDVPIPVFHRRVVCFMLFHAALLLCNALKIMRFQTCTPNHVQQTRLPLQLHDNRFLRPCLFRYVGPHH